MRCLGLNSILFIYIFREDYKNRTYHVLYTSEGTRRKSTDIFYISQLQRMTSDILRDKNKYTGSIFFECHRNFTYVHKSSISYLITIIYA